MQHIGLNHGVWPRVYLEITQGSRRCYGAYLWQIGLAGSQPPIFFSLFSRGFHKQELWSWKYSHIILISAFLWSLFLMSSNDDVHWKFMDAFTALPMTLLWTKIMYWKTYLGIFLYSFSTLETNKWLVCFHCSRLDLARWRPTVFVFFKMFCQ